LRQIRRHSANIAQTNKAVSIGQTPVGTAFFLHKDYYFILL